MPLPVRPLPTDEVEVNGEMVSFRSLSRAEAVQIKRFQDGGTADFDAAERYILAKACDVSEDEAEAWRKATGSVEASKLMDAILIFSGLATREDIDRANAVDAAVVAGPTDPKSSTSEPSSTEP